MFICPWWPKACNSVTLVLGCFSVMSVIIISCRYGLKLPIGPLTFARGSTVTRFMVSSSGTSNHVVSFNRSGSVVGGAAGGEVTDERVYRKLSKVEEKKSKT